MGFVKKELSDGNSNLLCAVIPIGYINRGFNMIILIFWKISVNMKYSDELKFRRAFRNSVTEFFKVLDFYCLAFLLQTNVQVLVLQKYHFSGTSTSFEYSRPRRTNLTRGFIIS